MASRIEGTIEADEIIVGEGVTVEEGVLITGRGGPARKVVLGDNAFIGRNSRIMVPEFRLGDYSKLHMHAFGMGDQPLQIGRNCWIGGHCVLDSQGGLDIDDNVGIGAQSQLWTHIQFGDIVEGSRFFSRRRMHVGKDAWFVGHCIVSPVAVGARSMAMVGSVITKDMLPNHVYAGVPAKDVTDKIGMQFESRSVEQKAAKLTELLEEFLSTHPEHRGELRVIRDASEALAEKTNFNVDDRTYTRTRSSAEVSFLGAMVPLIKFTPAGAPPFIDLVQNEI